MVASNCLPGGPKNEELLELDPDRHRRNL